MTDLKKGDRIEYIGDSGWRPKGYLGTLTEYSTKNVHVRWDNEVMSSITTIESVRKVLPKQYEFKVGDKGKTADGRDYEVLAILPEEKVGAGRQLVVNITTKTGGGLTFRSLNGKAQYGARLIPPSRTVYVNFYSDQTAIWHNSVSAAVEASGTAATAIALPVVIEG